MSDGVFLADGTFVPLLELATEPLLRVWEQEVSALLQAVGKITEQVVGSMHTSKHRAGDDAAGFRLEWPHLARHIATIPMKQVPMSRLAFGPCATSQARVAPMACEQFR